MTQNSNKNPISKLWTKMDSSPNLAHKLNEYNKLAKIVVVQVMGSMEEQLEPTYFPILGWYLTLERGESEVPNKLMELNFNVVLRYISLTHN